MVSEPYPRNLERAVVLSDGTRVFIRPIRPDDERRLAELYSRLGERTAYQRFFTLRRTLPAAWFHSFANVDYRRRLALVAEHDTRGGRELVGVGRYEPTEQEDTAEVAFVVEDGWQGRGLGSVLVDEVLGAAAARGIRRFRAYVLADNNRMLHLLAGHADILERRLEDGVVELIFTARSAASRATGARAS
jgi:RimJ/RimL family protein N-acetyltransferase